MITIRLLANYAKEAGTDDIFLRTPNFRTVKDVVDTVIHMYPAVDLSNSLVVLNNKECTMDQEIKDNDIIALFPKDA